MQPWEPNEGEIIDLNVKSCCDEKDNDISEEVMTAKTYTLKEILEIFDTMESINDTMLEANTKLERSETIYQGSFHIISCIPKKGRQALFKLFLIGF